MRWPAAVTPCFASQPKEPPSKQRGLQSRHSFARCVGELSHTQLLQIAMNQQDLGHGAWHQKTPGMGRGLVVPQGEAYWQKLGQPKVPQVDQPNLPEVEAIRKAAYVRM